MKIGLIGDFDKTVPAHQAIPIALRLANLELDLDITYEWIPTEEIKDSSRLAEFKGLWCVPASPYRSMEGALCGIQYARQNQVPFLGTCGGFQHALIEYARHVLGWNDAEHAETTPNASRSLIHQLSCSLVEVSKPVRLVPQTKIAKAYGTLEINEGYRCRYGLNPVFEKELFAEQLIVSARDDLGEVRAIELKNQHPFFVATLFQPERSALRGEVPPLVKAFARAIALI